MIITMKAQVQHIFDRKGKDYHQTTHCTECVKDARCLFLQTEQSIDVILTSNDEFLSTR